MGPGSVLRGLVSRALPTRWFDDRDADKPARLGPYGDLKVESVFSTEHLLADEGAYFSVNNGSPIAQGGTAGALGTALTLGLPAVATIIGASSSLMAIYNSDQQSNAGGTGKSIYLRRIQIVTEEATVPATTTAVAWGFVVDSVNRTPTSTVCGPLIPVNVNANSPVQSISRVYFCNVASGLTTPAAGTAVRQFAGYFKFAASVAKDVYELQFGGIDPSTIFSQATTVAQKYVEKAPPIIIGPQQWGIFYLAMPGAATNNVTYEPQVELIER